MNKHVQCIKVAPPYSMVFVEDESGADPPAIAGSFTVLSTEASVVVSCLCEVDGETAFILGATSDIDPGYEPAFVGVLLTPNRKIVIRTAIAETLLEMSVRNSRTVISVWLHNAPEPDVVMVGVT